MSSWNRRQPGRAGFTTGRGRRGSGRWPVGLAVSRAAALLVLGLLAGSCARSPGVPTSPNAPVVLVSIDTLRADHLSAYGYTRIRTPYLDRFGKEAWLFENAYTPCPMTAPAHTTMLTGQLPFEHGVRNNAGFVFDGQAHVNLPRLLKQHGYATGATVSSYVLRYETGLGPLFDYYEDSVETAPGVETVHYRRAGDKTEAFAKDWIAKHANEPFFFFLHIYEPHLPYDPPEPFRNAYGVTYDAMVATADAIVGVFLDDLKRLGVYDRALIVVTGDHGEGLGDHGEEQHSILLYREVMHVPLMVKLPGSFGGGARTAAPVQLSDITPTVTAVLGLETPKEVTGASLLAVAAGRVKPRVIYGETLYPRLQLGWSDLHCVLDARFHYISGPRPELYDMTADPGERHDLVRTEAATAARLAAELRTFSRGNERPSPVDQETLQRLAALGYIGGVRDRGGATALPNPMDNLKFLDRMQAAYRYADDKMYPQAIATLGEIVRENPALSDAWIKLGEVLSESGFDEESAAAYRQVLDRSPVFLPDIVVAWGFVELRLKKLDEAEGAGRRTAELVPTKAHELLARVALARGDLATAETEAGAAAGARNPQPSAILVTAEVKLQAGKPAEALEVVDRAEASARELRLKSIYDLEFLRGDALARLNRVNEAEAAFRMEIAAFPEHAQAYANLAVLRFLQGDRAGYERLIGEMSHANPSPRTYLLAALTFDALGLKDKAALWRRRADTMKSQER
jgi:arylsulfatase A-like enzyme/tetratricopeptide (TPR) repeat protein